MRKSIERWMRSEEGGLPQMILYALSLLYGAGVRLRLFLYAVGIFKSEKLSCKVVSSGNLTAGGSGKTPMTMHIARLLKDGGAKVVILSRGYKRSTTGVKTVSDGRDVKLSAREAGDEPFLMARRLKDIPVVIGEDRVLAGEFAIKEFSPDVVVLDDGFQHIQLARDLNILLVDARAGFGNGYLLPRGMLREPLRGISRADLTMVKQEGVDDAGLKLRDSDRLKRFNQKVITFFYRPIAVVNLRTKESHGLESLTGRKAVAVAGVADPEAFFASLNPLGLTLVKTIPYPDHHDYTRADLELIKKAAASAEFVITTEKDGVKLERFAKDLAFPLLTLSVDVVVYEPERFMKYLSPFIKEKAKRKDALAT